MEHNFRKLDLSQSRSSHSSPVNEYRRPRRRAVTKKQLLGLGILAFFILGVFFVWWLLTSPASSSAFHYILPGNPVKLTNDRLNVLLLGNGGGTHEGADLTDSIIVASLDTKNKKVTLVSIPRDLWLDKSQAKINTLYEVGKTKPEGGLKYAETQIGEMVGLEIPYAIRLDFNGFAKAIDLVGGINVNVPNTFDDYQYPIEGKENELCGYKNEDRDISTDDAKKLNINPGPQKVWIDPLGQIATDSANLNFDCRYEHIHFDKGQTQMDGTTALKFVRSRHGNNGEGSDFARSKRQQLVIQGFRQKVFSASTLINPQKISGLILTLGSSVETDLPTQNYLDFYKYAKEISSTQSIVLGDLGNGESLLIHPPLENYGGAWVLIPKDKDYGQIQKLIKDKLGSQ